MKKLTSKGIVGILSAVLIIAGAFLIGTPGSKVLANEQETDNYKFLTVKWQMSENPYVSEKGEQVKNLRIVTTIDADEGETYGNVGFDITFLGQEGTDEDPDEEPVHMDHKVDSVFHRIKAHDGGIEYEYGPKAFHATSEWLATCTITEIPEKYWDNGIVIKPYVTKKGESAKIWGQHRYLTMKDQENNVITIPVEDELKNPQVDGKNVAYHYDGTYTHVRLTVDYSTMPSISKYTVTYDGGSQEVKYRYLLSSKASDTTWYNEEDEENVAVIVNANEMRIFQAISTQSQYNGFAGKTIYLGADIDLNPGFNASAYSYKDKTGVAAEQNWEPIGRRNRIETMPNFAGTFDGNMHTIEGVSLIKEAGNGYGLFGQVEGATIKNFILSNSYFYVKSGDTTLTYTGSIVGRLTSGTIESVKCDDTVKIEIGGSNQYNGGIVGKVTNGTIKNCWFAGKIVSSGTHHGGIIGGLSTAGEKCTIENCLFTGNITHNKYTGDICGAAIENTELTLINTLSAGQRSNGSGSGYKGRILGYLATTGKITAENLYANKSAGMSNNIGKLSTETANPAIDANVTLLELDDFKGTTGYLNIDLDYYVPEDHEDGTWVIVDGQAPHLKVFADAAGEEYIKIREIGGGTNDARTVWYKPTDDKKTFVLYSAADFRGFQTLSESKDFAGQTIYLGADINLNPGWKSNDPEVGDPISWEPIGSSGMNSSAPKFAGIFDGDMHSISGVYLKTSTTRIGLFGQIIGGTVQNLILENSYLESTATANGRLGSIVGQISGTVDTVKVEDDVYVVANGTQYVGGLVGTITQLGEGTITNSWFAGQIQGTGEHRGGILGAVLIYNGSGSPVGYIKHCLVTGQIETCNNVGGICGSVWTSSTLTVEDSLFAGTFDEKTTEGNMGTVFGNTSNSTKTEVKDVYIRKVNSVLVDGYVGSGKTQDTGADTITGDIDKLTQQLDPEKLYFDEARTYATGLTIYPEGQDSSSDVGDKQFYWYVSEKYPVLASFGTPMTYSSLKVGTFNIKRAASFGDTKQAQEDNMKAIAQFIVDNKLDVCILNEVDNNCKRTNYMNQAEYIEQEVENLTDETYYSQFAAALDYETADFASQFHMSCSGLTGQFGNAIISRYPIEQLTPQIIKVNDAQIVENGDNDYEHRVLLQSKIDVNGTKVTVIGTHLGLNGEELVAGINSLNTMVQNINTPIVFAGDLNMKVEDELFNTIDSKIVSTTKGRYASTIPVDNPTVQYDYIFRSDDFTSGYAVVQNPLGTGDYAGKYLSDHRPLVVNLYMNIK